MSSLLDDPLLLLNVPDHLGLAGLIRLGLGPLDMLRWFGGLDGPGRLGRLCGLEVLAGLGQVVRPAGWPVEWAPLSTTRISPIAIRAWLAQLRELD